METVTAGQNLTKLDSELILCKFRPFYFITNYCYTLDPKDKNNKIKLIPDWKYIELLIENIHKNQNNLIEKTRQMIVSWITQAYNVWGYLFGSGYTALNLSRKEDLVDDKSHNSLFGKMRFIYDHLPGWIIEERLGKYIESNKAITFLSAVNKKYNNSVIGESANIGAGRGGSYLKVFADEFGFVERSESVYSSFDDACPSGKNLITTPPFKGKKCCFYRLREEALKGKNDFCIIRVHWNQHPNRNCEWYKTACKGKTNDEVARELDIDWNVAVKGRIYERWNTNKHIIRYKYQKELPLDLDFDFGIGESPVSIGFSQDLPDGAICYFNDIEYSSQTVDEIAPQLFKLLFDIGYLKNIEFIQQTNKIYKSSKNLDEKAQELINLINQNGIIRLIKRLRCYGDPAGKARGATGKSWISEFRKYGFDIQYTTNDKKRDLEYGHLLVQRLISQNKLLCTKECTYTIDTLENYKRKTDSEGNVLDSMNVDDNWAKHRADGIRYKIINTRTKKEFDEKDLLRIPAGL